MKKISALTFLSFLSCSGVSYSSDLGSFLDSIKSQEIKPAQAVEMLNQKSIEEHIALCDAIKGQNYYKLAQEKGVTLFKRNALLTHCQSYVPPKQEKSVNLLESGRYPKPQEQWKSQQAEVGTLKLPSAGASVEPVKKEKAIGQINIPSLFLQQKVTTQEEALNRTRNIIAQIGDQLESNNNLVQPAAVDIEEKTKLKEELLKAAKMLQIAQEQYDNMGVIVGLLREDIASLYQQGYKLQDFNPSDHVNDTNEAYLRGILSQPDIQSKIIPSSIAQLTMAREILEQSKGVLAEANRILLEMSNY